MLKNLPLRVKMIAIYAVMVIFTIPALIVFCLIISWLANQIGLAGSTAADTANQMARIIPWLCVLYVALYVGAAYTISHIIVKQSAIPLKEMAGLAKRLADGDVGVEFSHQAEDEVGLLARELRNMTETMRSQAGAIIAISEGDMTVGVEVRSDTDAVNKAIDQMLQNNNILLSDMSAAALEVSSGSKHIADGAQALAQGATEQAASVKELSDSISEIARKTKDNTEKAEKAAKLAAAIKNNADKGAEQMDEMMVAVNEINAASNSISKVIKVIDDIAFQTNILALNAAVEAARAGQYGKGFAVVAEEVRNLAAKSAEAAKDTGSLIENSIEKANLGVHIAQETVASLSNIITGINESSQLVTDIAVASGEQSSGIEFVNSGIDQVAYVVQQNSATAQESAAASEEMSNQSYMLQKLISHFKLKDSGASYSRLSSGSENSQRFLNP